MDKPGSHPTAQRLISARAAFAPCRPIFPAFSQQLILAVLISGYWQGIIACWISGVRIFAFSAGLILGSFIRNFDGILFSL